MHAMGPMPMWIRFLFWGYKLPQIQWLKAYRFGRSQVLCGYHWTEIWVWTGLYSFLKALVELKSVPCHHRIEDPFPCWLSAEDPLSRSCLLSLASGPFLCLSSQQQQIKSLSSFKSFPLLLLFPPILLPPSSTFKDSCD